MPAQKLFEPFTVGKLQLEHRVILAPLTRFRADDKHVHGPLAIEYYAQRAQRPGTLLITEATFISPRAGGYANVPGIWSPEQIAAWRKVTDAVRERRSHIACQLWALGRAAEPKQLAREGDLPFVSSSDVPMQEGGKAPRPLTVDEVAEYVADYRQAALNAVEAGFSLVEIHSANGYLLNQFLDTNANKRPRSDPYTGETVAGRIKFTIDVVNAIVEAIGAERVGIRFSPYSTFQGMKMPDKELRETYLAVVDALPRDLAYVHLVESRISGNADVDEGERIDFLVDRAAPRPVLVAGGFKRQSALEKAAERDVAVVFGRLFISNPDLVDRLERDLPLAPYDRNSFYSPRGPEGAKGYTDQGEGVAKL